MSLQPRRRGAVAEPPQGGTGLPRQAARRRPGRQDLHAHRLQPRRLTRALAALAGAGVVARVAETLHPSHATQLARRAVSDCVEMVVAAGGDGTIAEAAAGLAILPFGTADVLARKLGLSLRPGGAATVLARGGRRGGSGPAWRSSPITSDGIGGTTAGGAAGRGGSNCGAGHPAAFVPVQAAGDPAGMPPVTLEDAAGPIAVMLPSTHVAEQ